jgi:hypothetical protein
MKRREFGVSWNFQTCKLSKQVCNFGEIAQRNQHRKICGTIQNDSSLPQGLAGASGAS